MQEIVHRNKECRVCTSHDLDLVFGLQPSPIGDAYVTIEKIDIAQPSFPIHLYMCKSCGLAQLIDVIDPDILYGEYIFIDPASLALDKHFEEYSNDVMSRCKLLKGELVVNIQSNDGIRGGLRCGNGDALPKWFKKQGLRVLSIEPATLNDASEVDTGIIINKFFTPALAKNIISEHGHAHLITANNVLANVDDLRSWVSAIGELLAPKGVFVFESYYLADLVQNMVFDFIYHEHLSSFSVKPIQALFQRVGLELVAVKRVATKGGSLRYFVQRVGGLLNRDGSVTEMLELENRMGLYRKETFLVYADKINRIKEQTKEFLAKAKGEGKSVVGFGASISVTTLIYHFEIGDYLDYLVDDNHAKQGLFSPGLHLQVFSSLVLCERKPDYVVILAWRFAKAIIEKNQAYLESGGKFLIPVPMLNFITADR